MSTWAARHLGHLPGRCTTCGWHVDTQGHENDCSARDLRRTIPTITTNESDRITRQGRSHLIRESHDRAKKGRGVCYEPDRYWIGPDGQEWSGCTLKHAGCWHVHHDCTPDCGNDCRHHPEEVA